MVGVRTIAEGGGPGSNGRGVGMSSGWGDWMVGVDTGVSGDSGVSGVGSTGGGAGTCNSRGGFLVDCR